MRTCSMAGFLDWIGFYSTVLYTNSLNVYFMMLVTFKKSDEYTRKWVEPWLHGIPICVSVVSALLAYFGDHFNDDNLGQCWKSEYEAPHCIGYERGQIRDGFQIPCGRGAASEITAFDQIGAALIIPVMILSPLPLVIIYCSVRRLESKVADAGKVASRKTGTNWMSS